ncbi:hypothetical protein [Streptomyces sp. NPDC097619]|uniref:hypothetical protein n=1 Tax=Streptomyces sp. NPDC097619 TaxID=3157228 RepID=UPI0033287294
MRRNSRLGAVLLAAVSAVALGTGAPAGAAGPAADQKLDGTILVSGSTCTWTGASTSALPPGALSVDRTTVNRPGGNLSCTGGITATLDNNPVFTFDDAAGTARTDAIDITGKQSFISCRYRASGIVWDRQTGTRTYLNRAFTATKTSGSFLCPGSVTTPAGGASMLFR